VSCGVKVVAAREDPNANNTAKNNLYSNKPERDDKHADQTVRSHTGNETNRVYIHRQGEGDWTTGNETQVNTMRAGPAITQKETIRARADNHRETDDTRTSKQDTKRDTNSRS